MTRLICLVLGVACSTVDEPGPMDAGGAASGRVVHDHYRLWYRDFDGDGHGDPTWTRRGLKRPDGFVANATDCNDRDAAISWEEHCAIGVAQADLFVGIDEEDAELGARMSGATRRLGDGSVYLLYGPASGRVVADDLVSISASNTYFGSAVGAGDANGDALDDLLIADGMSHGYYLFLGPVTADRSTSDADAEIAAPIDFFLGGECADITRDFDGDGGADLVMTAPYSGPSSSSDGTVYVVSGTASGTLDVSSDATYSFLGPSHGMLGLAMAETGDTNGDGITDLALAAPYDYPPRVYIVPGGAAPGSYDAADVATATFTTPETSPSYYLGISLASADYDGDGAADLFAGAPGAPSSRGENYGGAVLGYLGPLSGLITLRDASVRWESRPSISLGAPVAADDFDGDGAPDVAMGSSSDVFVHFGYATGVVDVGTLVDIEPVVDGWITPIPDWTGDGGSELALGSPLSDGTTTEGAGKVYAFFSESLQ
jgi:hypothetical protein